MFPGSTDRTGLACCQVLRQNRSLPLDPRLLEVGIFFFCLTRLLLGLSDGLERSLMLAFRAIERALHLVQPSAILVGRLGLRGH